MDKKALEKAYNLGLKLEKSGQYEDAANAYREALLIDPDDHGGVAIRLASMGQGDTPQTASKAYVATLFNQTAELFDHILVDQLNYDVPLQLRDALIEKTNGRVFNRMLDLGCGTGLCADALDDLAKEKTGVDIAENMVEIAYEKGDYEHLFVADIVDFVAQTEETWDLIVATDVLPYMGDITVFLQNVSKCLETGGCFAFSTETLDLKDFGKQNFKVGAHQRFAHQQTYINKSLLDNAMEVIDLRDITVREEQGEAVPGQLFIAEKK